MPRTESEIEKWTAPMVLVFYLFMPICLLVSYLSILCPDEYSGFVRVTAPVTNPLRCWVIFFLEMTIGMLTRIERLLITLVN